MRNAGAVLEKPKIQKPQETCRHHWIISPALGTTSEGVCKLCGARKIFLNIVEDTESKEDLNRFFGKAVLPDQDDEGMAAEEDADAV